MRTMHGGGSAPSCCAFTHRVAFEEAFKVRRGAREDIPLIQGKRNPSKKVGVARGHQRADTLKP